MKNPLVGGCVAVLQQGATLLERLSDTIYSNTKGLPVQSGPGVHFRHCLDFYTNFLKGVTTGRVDYNLRERHAATETDRKEALRLITHTVEALENLPWNDGAAPLLVRVEDAAADVWCRSSLARELQALQSHTIHHYALIALLLRLQGCEPGKEFGVAPSTLQHWASAS